ncbi:hypothetical protein BASA81_006091 [Batrachochytrium salamandrivorans]|nr:hypothetical protein BASA81_006091 [Batrachochytrium salamandrivorans]
MRNEETWRLVARALQVEFSVSDERIAELYRALAQAKQPPCLLLDWLHDDLLVEIATYLDVATNLQVRRVCQRWRQLASTPGMMRYWSQAWTAFKGCPPPAKTIPSSATWERECKWAGLTGKPAVVTTLSGHRGSVTSLALAPALANGNELLVSGSDDGSLIVWSTSGGEDGEEDRLMQQHHRQSKHSSVARLHSLNGHHGAVWAVDVNQAGQVASGSFDTTVKLWDLQTGNCTSTLRGHENWVSSVHLGNDGVVASGGYDSMIKVWRADDNGQSFRATNLPTLENNTNAVYALDRHGSALVSGSLQSRFELFDLTTGALLERNPGAHLSKTYAVHLQSQDVLVTGGCDGKAALWDLRAKREPALELQAHAQAVLGVKMGDAGQAPHRLVTCSGDHLIKIFDTRFPNKPMTHHRGILPTARHTTHHTLSLHSAQVFCLGLTPNKLCSGSADGMVKLIRFDK